MKDGLLKWLFIFIIAGGFLASSHADDQGPGRIIERIAAGISGLKNVYPHFSEFNAETAVSGNEIIYRSGVTYVPNPEYEKLREKQENLKAGHPGIKLHEIPETLAVYSETNGIDLRITFFNSSTMNMTARVFEPYTTIGDWSVEVIVSGADTPLTDEIRRAVYHIIDMEKNRVCP